MPEADRFLHWTERVLRDEIGRTLTGVMP